MTDVTNVNSFNFIAPPIFFTLGGSFSKQHEASHFDLVCKRFCFKHSKLQQYPQLLIKDTISSNCLVCQQLYQSCIYIWICFQWCHWTTALIYGTNILSNATLYIYIYRVTCVFGIGCGYMLYYKNINRQVLLPIYG